MPFTHGRDSGLKLDNAAGTLVDITTYLRTAELDRQLERADVTSIGDQDKQTIPGFPGGLIPLGGLCDYADDLIFDIVATMVGSSTTRTVEYGPEGLSSGDVKFSAEVILQNFRINCVFDQPQSWEAQLRIDGAVTEGTFA